MALQEPLILSFTLNLFEIMAKFLKIAGANLVTPSNFDAYISCQNINFISATATNVVLNYGSGSTGTDIVTITIPSDATGSFQRELQNFIIQAAGDSGGATVEVPAVFYNGTTPTTANTLRITSVAIA